MHFNHKQLAHNDLCHFNVEFGAHGRLLAQPSSALELKFADCADDNGCNGPLRWVPA